MLKKTSENKERYQKFWRFYSSVDDPKKWPHWKILEPYALADAKMLEIGPGLRPKIPIRGGFFIDVSTNSLKKLQDAGAQSITSDLKGVPFVGNSFDVICAFEVLEHLENDDEVIRTMAKALKLGGRIFVSFPLHQRLFTAYDKTVGHMRRYEVADVEDFFDRAGLKIDQFSGIDASWPTQKAAQKLVYLEKKIPWLIPMVMKIIDSLPFAPIRKQIQLKQWNLALAQTELAKVSTGFFVLKT